MSSGLGDPHRDIVTGLGRPFRAENPSYPADPKIVEQMNRLPIHDVTFDCAEVVDRLHRANGDSGSKLKITPKKPFGRVYVPQQAGGVIEPRRYDYHYVYQNKGYIYDPRASRSAIPAGDYFKLIREYNPDGFSLEEEHYKPATGVSYRSIKS